VKGKVALRCRGQGGAVAWIALDYSGKEVERNYDPFPFRRVKMGEGAQVKVIGSDVAGRPFNRASDFVCLQSRFNYTCNTDRDAVLKLEDAF
jgi:hypothetical protein